MGEDDLHDQLKTKYKVVTKVPVTKGNNYCVTYSGLFVNCITVNSFIIYQHVSQWQTKMKRYTHQNFWIELWKDLMAGY